MSDKSSFEMILDAYCERCAFKSGVCDQYGCKCPAYATNLMLSKMVENTAEHLINPLKSTQTGFDV